MNICCIYSTENCVYGERPLRNFADIHLGLTYVATSLKKAGHTTQILVMTPYTDHEKMLRAYIQQHHPRLFCLTAVTTQYLLIRDIAKTIRAIDPSIYIILGGVHASLNPENTIKEDCFDAICIGEGERAIVEYASQIQAEKIPAHIKNLWIRSRETKEVERNEQAPFLNDLDRLPFLELLLWDKWVVDKTQLISVQVGRGCPNRCTYCSNHALARLCEGKYVRFRSPENVIKELQQLLVQYPFTRGVYLFAETFSTNLKYTDTFCEQLVEFHKSLEHPPGFIMCFSPHKKLLNRPDLLLKLKAANVSINMALESGSERVRHDILKRPKYTNADVIQFCQLARKVGIKVSLSNLIGIPGETLADYKETVDCLRQCNPYHANLFIYYPYPGTDLYKMAKTMNIFSEDLINPVGERKVARLDLPGFSRRRIQHEFLLFSYHIFKGRKPFYQIAARIGREFIFLHPRLNAMFKKIATHTLTKRILRRVTTNPRYQF